MVHWDFDIAWENAKVFGIERYHNFIENVDWKPLIENIIKAGLVFALTMPGKFSAMSPMFTASIPSLMAASLLVLQIFTMCYWVKFWAGGNFMLIAV